MSCSHRNMGRADSRAETSAPFRAPSRPSRTTTRERKNLLQQIFPDTGHAFVVGVTGAPGTGKSTLVDRLAGAVIAAQGKPLESSPSIRRARTPAARFWATASACRATRATPEFSSARWPRADFSGASRAPRAMSRWFWTPRASNIVLVETVGVGQDEVDIVRLADCTLVLLVPGMGDDVQNMKAGLMEIADIFVLNKSDREGADRLETELEAMLHLAPGARWLEAGDCPHRGHGK